MRKVMLAAYALWLEAGSGNAPATGSAGYCHDCGSYVLVGREAMCAECMTRWQEEKHDIS